MTTSKAPRDWALVLGASSGFGGATAVELARAGFNIAGVHLDRRATLPNVERVIAGVHEAGAEALFFNVNAADASKRQEVLDAVAERVERSGTQVRVLLHSLAFGTLRLYIAEDGDGISQAQMDMTLDVMAHSLVYWTQDLLRRNLMREGGRIYAMTSAGSNRAWPSYGAVSAAKAALESHIRQLALELAPRRITANAIRAGVTDTAAARKIPGYEALAATAAARNPGGRQTTPEDVSQAIALLTDRRSHWITGNVINVDGGEEIVG